MLNSLYEKAIAKRGFIQDIESDNNLDSQLEANWFEREFEESPKIFPLLPETEASTRRNF